MHLQITEKTIHIVKKYGKIETSNRHVACPMKQVVLDYMVPVARKSRPDSNKPHTRTEFLRE